MSMEKELARIADALERIEKVIGGAPQETQEPVKKKTVKKGAKKEEKTEAAGEEMCVADLMKYCNGKLADIKSPEERKEKVGAIVAALVEAFGVKNVKSIPEDKTLEAKAIFDEILGE